MDFVQKEPETSKKRLTNAPAADKLSGQRRHLYLVPKHLNPIVIS
jgi:hypothetical protein